MMLTSDGYLARRTTKFGHSNSARRESERRKAYRDWWLVKHGTSTGIISFGQGAIHLPATLIGKRVRFKIEVLEE